MLQTKQAFLITLAVAAVLASFLFSGLDTSAFSNPTPTVFIPQLPTAPPLPTLAPVLPTRTPVSDQPGKAGKILLVFGQLFIPRIYEIEVPAFEAAGYQVEVASRAMTTLQAKESPLQVEPDLLLDQVNVTEYDVIIFNCDNDLTFGSAIPQTTRIAQEALAQGKIIGAICSGPRVLAYAEVVEGRRVTGEPSRTCQMLRDAGATCTSAPVERDGQIITALNRDATQQFVGVILDALAEPGSSAPVAPPLVTINPPEQSKIVFTSNRGGDADIYIMNADGSDVQPLTANRVFDAMPDFSPDGTQIAFISTQGVNQDVYVMNVDGANVRRLTDSRGNEFHPAYSPDGTQIAFMSERDGNVEIYVMNADGSDQRRLTENRVFDGQPAWSPDGSQIAFVCEMDNKKWQICLMDADGENVRRLTNHDATDSYPAFSPDGSQIMFESMIGTALNTTELVVMNADSSDLQPITENTVFDSMPIWSPDGSQVLFVSDRDGTWMLYLMDPDGSNVRLISDDNAHHQDWWSPPAAQPETSAAPSLALIADQVIAFDSELSGDREIYLVNGDGSNLRPLTDNVYQDALPDWSPDGSQIAFFSTRTGDEEIWLMNADGSDPRQLTFSDGQDRAPCWSPDGSQIAYVSRRDDNQEIYVMNADGSHPRRLTQNDNDDFWPDWSPDGTQIVYTAVWTSQDQDLYILDVPSDATIPTPRLLSEDAARADWSPDGSRLAFSSNRNGDWEIFVMNPDGSDPQQVTENGWDDWVPTWSPDGAWLAWAGESGAAEIYVRHLASGFQDRITQNSAQDWRPIWRPAPQTAAVTLLFSLKHAILPLNTSGR